MDSASSSTGSHLEMPTELRLDLAGLPGSFHLMFFPQMACEVQGREGSLRQKVCSVRFQFCHDTHWDIQHQRRYIKRIQALPRPEFYRGQSLVPPNKKCDFMSFGSTLFICSEHTPGSPAQNKNRNWIPSIQCEYQKTNQLLRWG